MRALPRLALVLASALGSPACVGHANRTLAEAEAAVVSAERRAEAAALSRPGLALDTDLVYHLTLARLLLDEAKRLANDVALDDAEDLARRAREAAMKARPAGSTR